MIKLKDVSIFEERRLVVKDFNLEIKKGETVAIIGPHLSHKSKILRAIVDPLIEFNGEITVNHYKKTSESLLARRQLGYLPNPPVVEPHLTGYEFMEMVGSFYHLPPKQRPKIIQELAQSLSCESDLYLPLGQVDPLVLQKIAILTSLIHHPQILIWDEPIANLDFSSQNSVLDILKRHMKEGGCALIATNNLGFAQKIADRFVFMTNGLMITEGTLAQLKNLTKTDSLDLEKIYLKIADELRP